MGNRCGLPARGGRGDRAVEREPQRRWTRRSCRSSTHGSKRWGGGTGPTRHWRWGRGKGPPRRGRARPPPMMRLAHGLVRLDRDPLSPIETQAIADGVVPEDRKPIFKERGEVDFAYSVANVGRFRANVFRQRGSVSMVLRKLRFGGPSFDEIGLPDVVRTLADEHRGLILVTGPTGSGKTTTLAAMIGYLNATKPVHIVTVEDPFEVLHKDEVASINQREVGQDTNDFLSALRAALRQDPDVILIGEMRDTETVRAALQAAETGHLVM